MQGSSPSKLFPNQTIVPPYLLHMYVHIPWGRSVRFLQFVNVKAVPDWHLRVFGTGYHLRTSGQLFGVHQFYRRGFRKLGVPF